MLLCGFLLAILAETSGAESQSGPIPSGYTLKSWQTAEGLPQMTPKAITQASDGYLWVGTYSGLSRFDGVRFTSFTVNNTPELSSDSIISLYEDSAGILWIGTEEGGVVRYEKGAFSTLPGPEDAGRMTVYSICEHQGELWLGTSEGLYWVVEGALTAVTNSPPLARREVIAVMSGGKGELWIGTRKNLWMRNGNEFEGPIVLPEPAHLMAADGTGNLWISFSAGGIGVVEAGTRIVQPLRTRAKGNAFHCGRGGTFWLGTLHGRLFRSEEGEFPSYRMEIELEGNFSALYEDVEGNLWAGLEGKGLWRLRKKLVTTLGINEGLTIGSVTSIIQDQRGRIWAGTFGKGVHVWAGERFEQVTIPRMQNITSLAEDDEGTIWFSTFGGNMGRVKGTGSYDVESRFGKHGRTLFRDRKNGIWLGTIQDGLEHWSEGKLRRYTMEDGLSSDYVRPIAEDREGGIWVGTSMGLNRIRDGEIRRFFREDGLGGNHVRSLFVDHEGTLWIGSTGGGLTRWREGRLESIGVEQGLIDDWIEQIIEDDYGYLWLGSNRGLMRIHLEELNECVSGTRSFVHCTALQQQDGLETPNSGTGFQPSCLKAGDGKLWFATGAGIVVVDPAVGKSNSGRPAVFVEEVLANERRPRRTEMGAGGPLVFPAGTERLEFRYTGLDFSAPTLLKFRYQLEDFDEQWVNAGTRREAIYTRVPPGAYTFRVLAVNNEGIWNETGAALAIVIEPFFWQTGVFKVSAAASSLLCTGLLVWAFISWRHKQELAALEQRHALQRERTRIAEDMHDGLGSSLVKIAMLGELAETRLSEPDGAQPQIHRITTTARQVVREMDEIVWAVNPKNDTLDNFAGYLCQFATEHFSDTGVECRLEIPPQLPARSLRAEIRHNLFLATREALNNVLKHAQATEVTLRLECGGSQLSIRIEDNGRGSSLAPRKNGNGLANMESRLAQIGGKTCIGSSVESGTWVSFEIPLK